MITKMQYNTLQDTVGNTPLVRLQRLGLEAAAHGTVILAKLEGNNPAGSVKDRPALSMILRAQARGDIAPGDTLIEATSGNTGIALAMAAAVLGYRMILLMPEDASKERVLTMRAYGADIILTPKEGSMELARDQALQMQAQGKGKVLNQFSNKDNSLAHYAGTGPEIWQQTAGQITHFVSAMGTTGTISGTARYLKEQSAGVQIIGVQPQEGARISGIRKWPAAYMPEIYEGQYVDALETVGQEEAETLCRRLAREEGIFCGVSAAGACAVALRLAQQLRNATIVFIVCDRGDRYLSTGLFG